MTKIVSSFSAVATILGVLLQTQAAQATSARTWVSGAGSGSACTRALPCATFAVAYNATSAGGEIDVLDGGDFGPLVIQKALIVTNDGAGTAGIAPAGSVNPAIFINAGQNDAVVLRGLNLDGGVSQSAGIVFITGASLLIDRCKIHGFQSAPGIAFESSLSAAKLWVTDTVLSNDGVAGDGSVWIATFGGGAATAEFERVHILQGIGNGIRADGAQGGGAIDVALHDVTVDGAVGSGIVAVSSTSGGPAVNMMADEITSSHNVGFGVRAVGGTASVYLKRSTIADNSRGIGVSSGGAIVSYGDNGFANNVGGDGAPTSTLALK